ncbi:hypothetical protein X975_08447, partial [Stegodyphus mimosarum]
MPYGVSWTKYIAFIFSSLMSMAAGAQVVHVIYQPLKDLPEYVEREREKQRGLQPKETHL